jgi:hypothetical protein
MATGKKPASDAGRGLRDPKTPPRQRDVDASALAQAKRPKKGGKKKK